MSEDTIAAAATPSGRSALGIVRASGPLCRRLAQALLGPTPLKPRRATPRLFSRGGRPVDRVVATFWESGSSPTGEDLLELCAHGSPEILREITQACLESGARAAAPGEFTRRAFVNGRLGLAQARAVADLIAARGASARRAALRRLEGGLRESLDAARAPLLELLAHLEAGLDHPDADLPPRTDAQAGAALADCQSLLERLLAGYERGRARRSGARVGLFGRPNAGKSSLLNALLGRERAIVAAAPGTTRDLLEEEAELAGLPVTLLDTAGLRPEAPDPAEREGAARAERAMASCAVAVVVVDAADGEGPGLAAELARAAGASVLVAWNKIDLLGGRAAPEGALACSAKTGAGLDALARAIARAAAGVWGDEGEELLDDARQRDSIAAALAELSCARAELAERPGAWEERAANRLREALRRLSEAEGSDAAEDMLDAIFSRFCVGK